MTEPIRTVTYVGVAAAISLIAWATQPSTVAPTTASLVNQPLFPEFKDPLAASSLEIVQFDENSAELRTFQVAQQNGLWVIPSHGDYPADAEQQIRDAAGSLTELKIIAIASESAKDHTLFGVLEPDKTKLKVGDKDVGTLVALQDGKGNDLVRLIVGQEVDKAPGQRFVRKPGQEVVYITEISLDKLPTEFDKWIEKDLLKINTFDVSRLTLKDYSILPAQSGGFSFSGRMEASTVWNAEQSNWTLDALKLYSPGSGTWVDAGLAEQEELNRQKLDDLKTALDDLKIVDVVRKPAGLGSSLRAGTDILQKQELMSSLVAFGFLPAAMPGNDKAEIFATNGEVVVDMKDGVQYNLRFGNVEGVEKSTGQAKPGEAKPADDEVKLNRYLFVTAQLSPHTLIEPTYEPEPAGPAPAEAPKTDEPKGEGEQPAADQPADEKKPEDAAKPADPAAAVPGAADPQAAERDRIKRENERKRNEYNDEKKKAEARVSELNSRFADWYYVISEDVYKKIHLGRNDIVKEGATARDEGFGVDAFRKLESEGVDPPPAAPMSPGGQSGLPPGLPPGFPPM